MRRVAPTLPLAHHPKPAPIGPVFGRFTCLDSACGTADPSGTGPVAATQHPGDDSGFRTVRIGNGVVAVLDTILDPAQVEEAKHLADRVRDGLHSGELEPTAHSLGPLTDELL